MSNTVKIYVRTDLRTNSGKKVPNGKMASQTAHALMGAFLSLFENKGNELKVAKGNEALLKDYIESKVNIEIIPIKSQSELVDISVENKNNSIVITDQGRTSFNEPTITTMALSPKGFNYINFVDCGSEVNERYKSKQVIVLNKDQIKDKWEMFDVVAESSLSFLIELVKESESEDSISLEKEGLKNWINGAFAKITVKPKDKTFDETMNSMITANNDGVYATALVRDSITKCITFGADSIENIDKYTKDGYSLA